MNANTISNFGLLKRFNIEDKRQLAEIALGKVGGAVGAKIGSASGDYGKLEGSMIGSYIGSRFANDSVASIRAIKQVTQNPAYQNISAKEKLKQISSNAKHNSNNYNLNSVNQALDTFREGSTDSITKTLRQATLETAGNLFKYNKKNTVSFTKYKL